MTAFLLVLAALAMTPAASAAPAATGAKRTLAVPGTAGLPLAVPAGRGVKVTVTAPGCRLGVTVRGRGLRTTRFAVAPRRSVSRRVTDGARVSRLELRVRVARRAGRCRGRARVGASLVSLHQRRSPAAQPEGAGTVAAPVAPEVAGSLPSSMPAPTPSREDPAPDPPPAPGLTGTIDAGTLWVDPDSSAARTAAQWRAEGRTADATLIDRIAQTPQATWFGDWNGSDPSAAVAGVIERARAAGAAPVLVTYNIPSRDCGQFSAGGAASAEAYRAWLDGFARGIGSARAIVVVEPDALALLDCLSAADRDRAVDLVNSAARTLSALPQVTTYLDAGQSGWHPPETIAARLRAAGVELVRGFSLDVSNFRATAGELEYGERVSALTGGARFVVDTSRNGHGPAPDGQWCNPPGRALGPAPTTATGSPAADALLWIKRPGESDGACNGGPAAGAWWPDEALRLAGG